jgi:excisionase family DNA binding protein
MRTTKNSRRFRRLGYSIEHLAKEVDVGRSTIYQEIAAGRLVARKVGRRTVIRRSDAIRWLRSLPTLGRDVDLDSHPRVVEPTAHESDHPSDRV